MDATFTSRLTVMLGTSRQHLLAFGTHKQLVTANLAEVSDLHPGLRTNETYLDRPRIQASERGPHEGETLHRGADRIRT